MPNWFTSDDYLIRIAVGLGIVLVCAIIGRLLKSVMGSALMRFFERTRTTLDDRLIKIARNYVMPLAVLGGIYLGGQHVRVGLPALNLFGHRIIDYLNLGAFIALVLVLTSLIVHLLKGAVEWYVDDAAVRESNKRITPNVIPVFSKIVNIILFFLALLIILDHIGINIGGLVVSLGVGSLAVALAAQETISNLIGWFVIIIDQPFRIGDVVRLPSGEEGKVYQIGLRATRILNWDNNLVIVPNGEIAKSRVVNLSLPDLASRLTIDLNVAIGTDLVKARQIALDLVQSNPAILADPAPEIFLINFNDTGMLMRLMARSPLPQKFGAETLLREQIYQRFRENGIEIAIPQRIIHTVASDGSEAPEKK